MVCAFNPRAREGEAGGYQSLKSAKATQWVVSHFSSCPVPHIYRCSKALWWWIFAWDKEKLCIGRGRPQDNRWLKTSLGHSSNLESQAGQCPGWPFLCSLFFPFVLIHPLTTEGKSLSSLLACKMFGWLTLRTYLSLFESWHYRATWCNAQM